MLQSSYFGYTDGSVACETERHRMTSEPQWSPAASAMLTIGKVARERKISRDIRAVTGSRTFVSINGNVVC